MEWDVQLDDDFAAWLIGLQVDLRNEIIAHANLLRQRGPQLGTTVRGHVGGFPVHEHEGITGTVPGRSLAYTLRL